MRKLLSSVICLISIIVSGSMFFYQKSIYGKESNSVEQQERKTALKQMVPKMIEDLKTLKGEKKHFYIRDLGFSEDPRAIAPLIKIMKDKTEDIKNRRDAITALAHMKEKDQFLPALKEAFKDKELKPTAAYVLCRLGETEDTLSFLEQIALEGHPEVLMYKDDEHRDQYFDKESARQIFLKLADEGNDDVRSRVAVLLLNLGEKDKAKQTAINVAKTTKTTGAERGRIITYIIHVLVATGGDEAVQTLENIMNNDPSEFEREDAANALSKLGRDDLARKYRLKQLGIEDK